jgi:hypothetical protein
MKKLKRFVEENFERFSNLEEDEVYEFDAHYMDDDIVNYLKDNAQFNHNGIAVYYEGGSDEVWVENTNID